MPLQGSRTGGAGGVLRGKARCAFIRRPTVPGRSESSLGGACRAMKPPLAVTLYPSWRGVLSSAGSLGGYDGDRWGQTGIALREKRERGSTTHPFPPLAGTGKSEWLDKASPSVVSVAWSHETGAGIARASQWSYGHDCPPIPENSLALCICRAILNSICSTTRRIRAFVAMRPRFYGIVSDKALLSRLVSSVIPTRFPRLFRDFNCALPGLKGVPLKTKPTPESAMWVSTALAGFPSRQCFARSADSGCDLRATYPDWRGARKRNLYTYPRRGHLIFRRVWRINA
jgi:hypothetical protein